MFAIDLFNLVKNRSKKLLSHYFDEAEDQIADFSDLI